MIVEEFLVVTELLDIEGEHAARSVGAPGVKGLSFGYDVGDFRQFEGDGVEDQHVGHVVAGIALHKEQFVERKPLYLTDLVLTARIVEQLGVMAEAPVLSGPVLLEANGEIGGLWCAPQCHRTVLNRFDQMGIPHHLPGVPVLHVVRFVLAHVLFVHMGLA